MRKIGWPGKGWKFSCHRCGFWFPSTEIKKEWTGLLVCGDCWEPRHPQTLIKVHGEKAFPDIVSKDGPDTFVAGYACNIATSSGYADLGVADCMRADYSSPCSAQADVGDADYAIAEFYFSYTYDQLVGIFGNGH